MSRLDELKSGAPSTPSQDIDIDMTADIDGLDHHAPVKEAAAPNRVSITRPNHVNSVNGVRRTIDAAQMQKAMGVQDEAATLEGSGSEDGMIYDPDKFAQNILSGEGSVLEKWKKEKIEEYNQRMEEFDQEREELIEEGKLDPNDIKDPDYVNPNAPEKDSTDADNDDEDEDEDMSENVNQDLELDDEDLLSELDNDDEGIVDDIPVEEVVVEEPELESEAVEEEVKIEPVAKEEGKEEEKKIHITEEDQELFDSVGEDVDANRFAEKDEDDEEEKKDNAKDDDDVFDDEDEENLNAANEAADRSEETLKHLKDLITERLKPSYKTIDISKFTIKPKKSSGSAIRTITDNQKLKVFKWVLPNQKQCVFMKQFTGLELQTLSENIQEGSLTSMNIAYRMIYDHIVSNKPAKFTDWLNITPDSDIDHYMFCVFIASYKGTNFLPMDCPNEKCPDPTFLTDDIPIMDMVKFKDDEAKNKFTEIYKSEIVYSNRSGYYVTAVTPISADLAIGFKESTLKDVIDIEGLDEKFRNKYRTTINLIPYIDTMYQIDYENQNLVEITIKETDNAIKNLRTKIRTYHKLIDTLTSDEFGVISAVIQQINTREDMISYIVPEVECPACGRKIAEVATSATQLVFTRYQLGALLNTTLS